jgi:predicted ATPase
MKLKSISFENYKAFKEKQNLELRPITILIGKNSSGKSIITKLFTLLDNSLSRRINEPLLLNNYGIELGAEFRDLQYARDATLPISFKVTYQNNAEIFIKIIKPYGKSRIDILEWNITNNKYKIEYVKSKNLFIDSHNTAYATTINGFLPNLEFSNKYRITLDYVGPFRALPKRQYYFVGEFAQDEIGVDGKEAYQILINSYLEKTDLLGKVSDWYEKNFGWKLEIEENKSSYEFLLLKEDGNKKIQVNLADVGQGMHQALPLVVRANMLIEDSIIVLEQPELHLHTAAHADLAELFARSAKEGNQTFVIETHSENVLLRLRKLVIDNDFGFTKDDIIIYWVGEHENGGQKITPITIDEEGTLSDWFDDAFNENVFEMIDIRKTLKTKRAKK